jgi:transcriptional regulator with XRE-family HTH domain
MHFASCAGSGVAWKSRGLQAIPIGCDHGSHVPRSSPSDVPGAISPALLLLVDEKYGTIPDMVIGDRLRAMREDKKLSQGDIEKRTGLLRCYISRVENGHTVPAIETLEKLARALECPLYQLFYDGEEPPKLPNLLQGKTSDDIVWGSAGKDARFLQKLRRLLGKVDEPDRKLILYMTQKMANSR